MRPLAVDAALGVFGREGLDEALGGQPEAVFVAAIQGVPEWTGIGVQHVSRVPAVRIFG